IAQLGILPKHVWENIPAGNFPLSDINLSPVGSGPFSFREIKKSSDGTVKSIVLKANPNYYEGRPYLDRITFNFYPDVESMMAAFQSKEIQAMGYVPYDKKASENLPPNYTQLTISLPQYQAAFFNLKTPIFADKSVRQALWLTTERDPIINDVYLGLAKPAYGPILEGNLGYDPHIKEMTHFNLDEAKGILDKAGWVIDPESNIRTKNKKPLEFTLTSNNNILNIKTAKILQEQWNRLNINVQLAIVSPTDLEQQYLRPRAFDVLLFGENTGADPDPFPFWHSTQARDPYFNLSGFSDPTADKLLNQARQTNDANARSQAYIQFQAIFADQIPAIFLNSTVYVYEVPKKLKGIELSTITHQSERFLDVAHWYIKTK
ncbi:MAG: peptide ABC transporter substrate-binding protein, partial [Acidobacteriaceae bacterium]